MQFEIKIDPAVVEPKVLITTATVTEEVLCLLEKITDQIPFVLIFTKEDKATRKEKDAAIRFAKTLDCPYAFSSMKASPSSSRSLLLSLLGKCD